MTRDRREKPLRVLVVEDNPGDVHLIREALEGSAVDSSLTVLTDGEAVLDYLRRRDDDSELNPDLAILDLNVPKVAGRTILEEIDARAALRSVPVFVLSGSKSTDDVRETYERGADGYFVKPVDPDEFISLVRSIETAVADAGRLPSGEFADVEKTG